MQSVKDLRIAWIYPSIIYGAYWQPVMREFTKLCENVAFYTGCAWPGFDPNEPDNAVFKLFGQTRYVNSTKTASGYDRAFIYASPWIFLPLFQFRPQVVFASAFSIWTLIALLFKPLGGWKVIIIYDGSSPNSDFRDSKFRSFFRRRMARLTDAFVANSKAAKEYLTDALNVPEHRVFVRTYLVPDAAALQRKVDGSAVELIVRSPSFLYVGQLIHRKGVKVLLDACALLRDEGYQEFSVVLVGDGAQRQELEAFVEAKGLSQQVIWTGWVDYGRLAPYFKETDVFVFPTLEDVWGMVVLEAMVFGKPVLCSKGANSCEMVTPEDNGYIFDPGSPQELASVMKQFLQRPDLAAEMGARSKELIAQHTPKSAADAFSEVALWVLNH